MSKQKKRDPKLEKWLKWVPEIKEEIQTLLISDMVFWGIQDILKANPRIGEIQTCLWEWQKNGFVNSAVIGMRRLRDNHPRAISAHNLLKEISESPQLITQAFYLEHYRNSVLGTEGGKRAFRKFDPKGLGHVDPDLVKRDLKVLLVSTEPLMDLADRRIAHRDKIAPKSLPTFNDLTVSMKIAEKIVIKYLNIFFGDGYFKLLPTFQYDWKEPFRYPWIKQIRSETK